MGILSPFCNEDRTFSGDSILSDGTYASSAASGWPDDQMQSHPERAGAIWEDERDRGRVSFSRLLKCLSIEEDYLCEAWCGA